MPLFLNVKSPDMPGKILFIIMKFFILYKVTWLAYYKDDTINTAYKYIFLSAESKFKGLNDIKKYEKARKLKNMIQQIRDNYTFKMKSESTFLIKKQLINSLVLLHI